MFRVTAILLLALAVSVPADAVTASGHDAAVAACKTLNFTLKTQMMRGWGEILGYSRNSGCGYECGRKTFRWDNGPQGFGDNTPPGTSTQWPSSLNMGATFDPDLALAWGTAMGEEFWGKGTNIQEGPGVNVARINKNGRTFEYISGEDPVLGVALATNVIQGIQQNVMAITKHYILNNQETDRSGVNEIVDEKTIMELYAPPFEAAAAHTAGYMCSYNRINGDWSCEHPNTMKNMLRDYFNFTGFVVSDWGACHSTNNSLRAGLDIEMPMGKYYTEETIQAALDGGVVTMQDIDDRCVRILSGWYSLPEDRRHPCDGGVCILKNVSTPAHKALARNISSASTVLLKNEGDLLPLASHQTIALIGPDADKPYTAGQGSGSVKSNAIVSPLAAFSALGLNVTYNDGSNVDEAVAAAKKADVAIVFGSAHSGEGHDRVSLSLGGNIDDLIPAIASANKNTVVVLTVPGPILTPWRDNVPALLTNFLPGEQVGPALADIVFGQVAPSAKLPVTFPNVDNEQGMTKEQYPGVPSGSYSYQATYSEGQIVAYRWYDKHKKQPAFPFGHGLTYGAFTYSDLKVAGRTITFTVTRSSSSHVGACDTPQVYLSYPTADSDPTVPAKVLRSFAKVCDATSTITYTASDRDVSNWDVSAKEWTVTKGTYGISVGASSQDIRLTGHLDV